MNGGGNACPAMLDRALPQSMDKPAWWKSGKVWESMTPPYTLDGGQKKTADELVSMRTACRLAREVLEEAGRHVRAGVTTQSIDDVVWDACMTREVYPSPLNYMGFPRTVCTSVNDVVCHGIPTDGTTLVEGDLINVDVTIFHEGFHGDNSMTFLVLSDGSLGYPDESALPHSASQFGEAAKLMRVTQGALDAAIGT
jgi:methionyl aminopeptidase